MTRQLIRLKRVYDPPSDDDGCRILVDGVWPRGVSRERLQADLWLKEAAPSASLRRWFGHDPDRWEEFQARYFDELRDRDETLDEIRRRLREGTVTLLFAARDTSHNQAVALKAYLEGG